MNKTDSDRIGCRVSV